MSTTQPIGFTMWSLWNEGDQAELVRLLLELARHCPHVDNDAIDRDHPHQGIARELAREAPPRIQWTDVEDLPDLARLRRAGALTDAAQRAQLAAGQVGLLRRIEQEIDGADRVHQPTRPRVTVTAHQRRR